MVLKGVMSVALEGWRSAHCQDDALEKMLNGRGSDVVFSGVFTYKPVGLLSGQR